MAMDSTGFSKLEALFHALIEIPRGPERDSAALILSQGDAELALRALKLVESDEQAAAANHAATEANAAPRIYGNYRTVRHLGSGGMGAVFLGERADGQFEHTVAIKIIAPYVAGETFRERFRAERQILAGLNHPNITKLLDGGVTPDGTPYIVIEYVEGLRLDQYCDQHRLSLRQRLELFRKVCEPVAYAHRNLVVHRDLKPSNILVTGEGQPMLLDFGTAQLVAREGTDVDAAPPLLTLRYSSPEQRGGGAIATSTDVFSLGVILFELLTGAWPFGDPSSPQHLREAFAHDTPMTAPEAAVTEEAALARSAKLKSLRGWLAGDLGHILAKALAAEPEHRYESVQALSADIGNWLDGLPITARPATFAYRAGTFLRRHWLPLTLAAVFVLGLLGSALFALREAGLARAEAVKAEKVGQFLSDTLSSASEYTFDPQKFTVAQLLDAAAPRLETAWKNDPQIEAALRLSLGSSYTAVQRWDQGRVQLETARAIFQKLGNREGEARACYWLAVDTSNAGSIPKGMAYYHDALQALNRMGMSAPPMLVFQTKQSLAEFEALVSVNLDEGRKLATEAIQLAEHEPTISGRDMALAQTTLGAVLLSEGKKAESEAMLLKAVDTFRREKSQGIQRARPFYYLMVLSGRNSNFAAGKEWARQYYEVMLQNLGPHHVATEEGRIVWARYRAETGEAKEAAEQALDAMVVIRKSFPPLSLNLWTPLTAVAHILNLAGRFAEAETYAREDLAVVERLPAWAHDPRKAESLFELGKALRGERKYREADVALEQAAEIYDLSGQWAKRAAEARKLKQ
jgi:tetratricopeptide (TPR) repeat protein